MPRPAALTIAGSDPSGGAGLQADLKTFHQFDVYGEAVVSLITVQNSMRVDRVECLDAELVRQQLRAVLEDLPPNAAKTGALGNRAIVEMVAQEAARFDFPLVVDPVMISKHGHALLADDAIEALVRCLIPRAFLLMPNIPEAEALTGIVIRSLADMRSAAVRLTEMGARAVLIKGGHLQGEGCIDILRAGGVWLDLREFHAPRIDTPHTHGTGCTYSAAITAELARGASLDIAVEHAKEFITEAIRTNPGLGHGCGPVNHHARRIT